MTEDIDILNKFSKLHILIIGDVMIDRYLYGKVNRISPEAPVPVVALGNTDNRLGGAANVALNIAALGSTPLICSIVGKDNEGQLYKRLMYEKNLDTTGIVISEDRRTTIKSRVIAQNQQLIRLDSEDKFDLSETEYEILAERIETIIEKHPIDLILFQDYNKGILTTQLIQRIIKLGQQKKILTAVDPKYNNFFSYQKIDLFKPNLKEASDQVPFPIDENHIDSLDAADTFIRSQLNNRYTMITLSEKGIYLSDGKASRIFPTQPRIISDVCGAGDTVISVAALGLAAGFNMDIVCELANLAGGQVCEKVGVVSVDKDILIKEYWQLQLT